MDWTSTMKEEVAAATKIQAVVRGFNVRRRQPLTHLRKIASVRQELSDFQAKAADPAYIERICVDVMECRKLTEGIMSLLLQLDAIQGVHPVVRDIRKSVNREVVQFMEVIDAVVVGADTSPWQDTKNTPNIGRSNSISHIDRVASHSLKRMHSLDNCTYPEQLYKRKDDSTWNSEHQKELNGKNTLSDVGRADYSIHDPFAPNIDTVMGNSVREGMDYHSDLESLRILTAVLTIQSSFRGYRVRRSRPLKHLRIIADVRAKLRELTVHVSSPNFLSSLRSDKMERLKTTESITALLLQLDSVQGVSQEIRDIRKSVTRDVFKLQEVVDMLISDFEIVERPSALPCNVTEPESDHLSAEGSLQESELSSLDDWTVAENSAGEDVPLDSLSLHSTGHESMDDKVGPTTPECDEQGNGVDLGDVSTDPSAEDNCRARDLERVQVRVLDRPLQNNTTSSSLSESPEGNRLSDQESGPCAAVVSGNDYSSGVSEEHAGAVQALKSHHLSMKEVSPREAHCEDMSTPKVGNRQWHDKFVDVLDVEARACRLSESASSEDLQAQALDSVWRTTVKGRGVSFVRDIYDTLNMESLDSYQKASIRQQECGMRTTAESPGSTFQASSLEQIKSDSDDYTSAGIAQSYRSVSDDYISDGTALSENSTPAGIPENHISHSDDWVSTGRNGLTDRTLIDDFFPAEAFLSDNETPAGIPGNHEFLIDDYVPAGPYCSAPIQRSLHKNCRPAGSAQIDDMGEKDYSMSTLPDSPSVYGSRHGSNAASMNEAVLATEQHGDVGSMDSGGQLADENAKLRGLLNQVLIFAEMQSSKVSAVMGTNEKLETENMRYKKREEVWRKKSKSARRRR